MAGSQKLHRLLWADLFSKRNEAETTVLHTLRSNQLFAKLTARELVLVARAVHLRTYEPGEVVFAQGEKGLGMYMIAKGYIEIKTKPEHSEHKADPLKPHPIATHDMIVTTLGAGSFFGELALIDEHNKRTASAQAKGPTTLIGFFKPDLMDLIERKPEMGVKILHQIARVLAKRLTETTDTLTAMANDVKTVA